MASDNWPMLPVDSIKAKTDYAIAIGPFGSRMKSDLYVSSGVPVIRGTNISSTRELVGDLVCIAEGTADKLKSSNVFPDDLVFPHRGAIGQVGIVPRGLAERYMLSSSLMKLTCDRTVADPQFLFYFFRSPDGQHELLKNASTVGTPGIGQPLASLRSILVPVPALSEQHAIAHILGTLDDKIELNRRMNETLEAMARALFQSWFVDFDPVRAKAEGRDPGLPKSLADLFPDSFGASELGEIPRSWRVSSIRELAHQVQYGLTESASLTQVGPHFLRITDIQGGKVNWAAVPFCKVTQEEHARYRVGPGDILVARTGASTGENVYLSSAPDAVFASYLVRFKFLEPATARLVGAFMRTVAYFEHVAGCVGGSAQPNASAQLLAAARLVTPAPQIALKFYDFLAPLDSRISANNEASRTLAALRDTLLPKLISGELRIKDAERTVGTNL
jgi:type I restriction enzyme, S subunit